MGTTMTGMSDIKRLREETGAGIMDCKRALEDSGGDYDKAAKLLEQRGAASAAKRAGRTASQGVVEAYIHHGGQVGVLVELDCETDFVARTEDFRTLAREIAMQIAAGSPAVPRYVTKDEIPADEAEEMRARFRGEAVQEGKPEKIAGNIAEGKFNKYAQNIVLLEQPYIRDDSKTVGQLVQDVAAKTGENVVVRRFSRFQVGA